MFAHSAVAAVSDRRRRSEIDATIYAALHSGEFTLPYRTVCPSLKNCDHCLPIPDVLKPYRKPLPFCYQSTGIETRFTNLMEPDARSRPVFAFHRPETLADWLMDESKKPGSTLRARLKHMPPLSGSLPCSKARRKWIRRLKNNPWAAWSP